MAEEQKKSKLETVKEASNYLRGTIAEHLARDTPNFRSDTDAFVGHSGRTSL